MEDLAVHCHDRMRSGFVMVQVKLNFNTDDLAQLCPVLNTLVSQNIQFRNSNPCLLVRDF